MLSLQRASLITGQGTKIPQAAKHRPLTLLPPKRALLLGVPWCLVVQALPSNAEVLGSIPGRGTKVPHTLECGAKKRKKNDIEHHWPPCKLPHVTWGHPQLRPALPLFCHYRLVLPFLELHINGATVCGFQRVCGWLLLLYTGF